jgi:hypothetical protein
MYYVRYSRWVIICGEGLGVTGVLHPFFFLKNRVGLKRTQDTIQGHD